ncbi:2-phosphosulfolactate phosphatase [Fodinisporobacter ferrooxydans]|uniref:Probable 2-phosphosulfolactate phosphatase n=1 Tax=Fodinisporobacter ferrooxydans TaxID=2901836 RepID=A0ABY4CSZ2_9BACL|nr:2-phosphosulfolactate phosphatase [Alicyclobacillaceae bacterium MYW30-H2]
MAVMRKIHVITQKEAVQPHQIKTCTAVVTDVLLATSTIATLLHHGAKEVIPVADEKEGLKLASELAEETYMLCGEQDGHTLDGFLGTDPETLLAADIADKAIILSTTNGTVAIRKSMLAKTVYTASFLNGQAVAKDLQKSNDTSSILLVCSGSQGRFSIEDFLGAGYLISELVHENISAWTLTDSAKAAFRLYEHCADNLANVLRTSETGNLLRNLGYPDSIEYVTKVGALPIVPRLVENRLVAWNV